MTDIPDDNEEKDFVEEEIVYEDEGEVVQDKERKLREKLKKSEEEKNEYLLGWQRAKADSINVSKQHREEIQKLKKRVEEDVMLDLLPVLDSFDMAMSNKEIWEKGDEQWRRGVEYIYSQLIKVLGEYGVKEIVTNSGDHINFDLHNPIKSIDTNEERIDDTVSKVIQKGYKNSEVVLRPATVEVYKYNHNQG